MKEDFILPDIGEGIVECELVEWLVNVGDIVEEDQPVADVQTDKALVQIPAKHAGRVEVLYVEQGEIAKVHAPLFQIFRSDGEGAQPASSNAQTESKSVLPSKVESVSHTLAAHKDSKRQVLATPAVRRIAREENIDIKDVQGSGPSGRILKQDMLSFLESDSTENTDLRSPTKPEQANNIEVIAMKGIRAVMAEQMMKSVSTIPHFTYAEEIDVSACNDLRRSLNNGLKEADTRLTLMSFFIKSLSLALHEFPIVNSHMSENGQEILQYSAHNIGMAVDSPMGLLVPNVKNVEQLSLLEIADEVKRLTEAGRAGRLAPEDMKGGTLTISNIGAIGGTVTTPIINTPEVAIVGIGRIQKLPRFDADGKVVSQEIICVSWSGDHRVIDGGTIARFNNAWKHLLEQPQEMLLHLR